MSNPSNPESQLQSQLLPGKAPSRVKTPVILQMEAVECGAVALSIILSHYGRHIALDDLRLLCGVSRDGCNAGNLLRAAKGLGLDARGFRKDIPALQSMRMPCVVFWNFNHFLVVEGFCQQGVYLNDPASGPRLVSWQEFDLSYTGVALNFDLTPAFRQGGRAPSLWRGLFERLRGHQLAFGYLLLVGLSLVIPGLAIPAFARIFVDDILLGQQSDWLWPLLFGMSSCALLRALLMLLQKHYLLKLESSIAIASSSQLLWHLLRLPIAFYTQRYAGEIAGRVAINDRVASMVAGQLPLGVLNLLSALFFLAVMLSYDYLLATISLLFAFCNLALLQSVASRRKAMNQRLAIEEGKLTGSALNGLSLMESLKASGAENEFFEKWAGYQARWLQAMQEQSRANLLLNVLPSGLVALEMLAIIGVGGLRVMDGAMSLGMLVAFQSLAQSFSAPVQGVLALASRIGQLQGDMDRLNDVLRVKRETEETEEAEETAQPAQSTAEPAAQPNTPAAAKDSAASTVSTNRSPAILPSHAKMAGHIELRNVNFGYNRAGEPLLRDFSLKIQAGQRIALVGPSGCGKSTVARLVMGLFQAWSGEILFDGKPRQTWSREQLANSIAMVDQEIALFEGSVRDNLTLWDDSVSEQALVQAARDACLHEVILSRPGGYDAKVSEAGRNFSGGQRQRLEIARALVNQPRILLLDEATSALDPVAERDVEINLRHRGCTCLIVAHRLSTVRDCDCIYVLQQGRIVEQGSHAQLMQIPSGIYQKLAQQE